MPIYEYYCAGCLSSIEKIQQNPETPCCEACGEKMIRVVELPGYRRDHTVVVGHN